MISKDKFNNILWFCYRELYKRAVPPADFDKLVEKAKVNKHGEKEIPFSKHECTEQDFEDVFKECFAQFKITSKWEKQMIKNSVLLGCAPKTKKNGKQ